MLFNHSSEAGFQVRSFPVGALQCNCSLIWDPKTKEALVVDPGGDFSKIKEEIEKEKIDFIANHTILKAISASSDGKFFQLNDYENVFQSINENGDTAIVTYEEKEYKKLIEIIWFLVAITCIFSIEWFIRRRLGSF